MPPRKITGDVAVSNRQPALNKSCRGTNKKARSSFYHSGSGSVAPQGQQALSKLFDKYRGPPSPLNPNQILTSSDDPQTSPDKIGLDGAQSYLTDLTVALDDIALLCLCELLSCASIGEFDREPFINGWQTASTGGLILDTLPKQAACVAGLRNRLPTDGPYFKRVYRYAFNLAKPPGQKSVPMDSALEFWAMFFSGSKGGVEWNGRSTKWLDEWLAFYESKGKRPVNKDLWNMVYELVVKTKEPGGEDLGWWTEDGAWPMAVDEFVAHVKEKRGTAAIMDLT